MSIVFPLNTVSLLEYRGLKLTTPCQGAARTFNQPCGQNEEPVVANIFECCLAQLRQDQQQQIAGSEGTAGRSLG